MKKFCILALCLAALLMTSCGKSDDSGKGGASINGIPAAEADKTNDEQNNDSVPLNDAPGENADSEASADASGEGSSVDTSDRTPASDRSEIKNNIRDAKELIDAGETDDAKAVIKALRSRKLTADEEKEVDRLEARLLSISD